MSHSQQHLSHLITPHLNIINTVTGNQFEDACILNTLIYTTDKNQRTDSHHQGLKTTYTISKKKKKKNPTHELDGKQIRKKEIIKSLI